MCSAHNIHKMDLMSPNRCSPGVNKRKIEEDVSLVRKEESNNTACKISEKVATCVPQILEQLKGGKNVVGRSVSDVRREAERRKSLLLGFDPNQRYKRSTEETVEVQDFTPTIAQPQSSILLHRERSRVIDNDRVEESSETWLVKSRPLPSMAIGAIAGLGEGAVFDSHCHLDVLYHRFRTEKIAVSRLVGSLEMDGEALGDKFGGCVTNFHDPREWSRGVDGSKVSEVVKVADNDDRVYLSIGCHPHFADRMTPNGLLQLDRLVRGDREILMSVVAIGECGLDYSVKNTVDKDLQKKVFYDQLLLGLKYNLPIVLHIRDAEKDGYEVLEHAGVPADWIMHRHCFTGDWSAAATWLHRFPSSKIGIAGCVTFNRAAQIHQTVRNLPLNRILLETDAPYFLPVGVDSNVYPFSFSQPGHVIHVAAKVAQIKRIPLEEVLAANRRNVTEVYGIKLN